MAGRVGVAIRPIASRETTAVRFSYTAVRTFAKLSEGANFCWDGGSDAGHARRPLPVSPSGISTVRGPAAPLTAESGVVFGGDGVSGHGPRKSIPVGLGIRRAAGPERGGRGGRA